MTTLERIPGTYSLCKLRYLTRVDLTLLLAEPFYALSKSPEETTLLCSNKIADAFEGLTEGRRDNFKAIRFAGSLSPTETGVLAALSKVLSEADVSIYVQSTFETDYVLFAEADADKAEAALSAAGYEVCDIVHDAQQAA
jgi:hypothetical protein